MRPVRERRGQSFTYTPENRLQTVIKSGQMLPSYNYDYDGKGLKRTVGSVVTVYVGGRYEINLSNLVITHN